MEKNNTITLTTYGEDAFKEIEFTVSESWLGKHIDGTIQEFLNTYTFDDSEILLESAKKENAILKLKELGAVL